MAKLQNTTLTSSVALSIARSKGGKTQAFFADRINIPREKTTHNNVKPNETQVHLNSLISFLTLNANSALKLTDLGTDKATGIDDFRSHYNMQGCHFFGLTKFHDISMIFQVF